MGHCFAPNSRFRPCGGCCGLSFFPAFEGVCLARMDDHCQAGYGDSPRAKRKRECSSKRVPVLLLQTHQFTESDQRISLLRHCEKELADEGVGGCCLERRSFVGAPSSLARDDCDEDYRMMCHRVGQRQLNACVHGFCFQARTLLWWTKTLFDLEDPSLKKMVLHIPSTEAYSASPGNVSLISLAKHFWFQEFWHRL